MFGTKSKTSEILVSKYICLKTSVDYNLGDYLEDNLVYDSCENQKQVASCEMSVFNLLQVGSLKNF